MQKSLYEFSPDDARRFAREQGIRTYERGDELHFKECPYCHGNAGRDKKTFAINLQSGQFQCMRASCGARGNMITLARDFGFSLGRDVDEYYGRKDRYKNMRRYPRPKSKTPAIEYMETRGISRETTEAYAITVQRDHDNIIVFPFFNERGEMEFAKYRKTDFDPAKDKSKEWCETNCKPILFGMDHCDSEKTDTLVMTEGQIDSLSCAEAGIPNAVSVPTGKNGFTWIPHCWDFLCRYKTLIVFGDHERDEITLLDDMRKRFPGTVKHVRPEDYKGCKDANELLQKHGKQAIVDAVTHAVPVKNPHIIDLSDVKRLDLSQIEHFNSGIPAFDQMTGGFFFGQLIILTGECGMGKSTLGSQFLAQALEQGHTVFGYSGELPDWMYREWFDRQLAGPGNIIHRRMPNGYVAHTVATDAVWPMQTWYRGRVKLRDSSIIVDDSEHETLPEIVKSAIVQYGCRVLLLDNLMTAMEDDLSADQYRQQTIFCRKLAQMAQAYDVVIFLVAHPRKSNAADFRNDDVSGSGNITNLAGMVLQYAEPRDEKDPGDRILRVTKNRYTGRTCYDGIPLWFDESSKRISATEGDFGWHYGWESQDMPDGFIGIYGDMEIPFGDDEEGT